MTLALLLTAVTGAWAQGPWTSGDCTLTLNNGTLTVSGNGGMADYPNLDQPWVNNKGDITSVVVESGVTTVGSQAFCNFGKITSVTLPEGLTSIGTRSFLSCSKLTSVTIPSTVTSIGADAFYSCTSVTDVNLYADPANLTWNEDGCDDFNRNPKGSTKCHVLAEYLTAYQTKFNGQVNVTFVGDLKPLATSGEVTTNAASEQDLFTEAWFKMPPFDATVNYMLVRDMQDEANPVAFSGLPTNDEPIIVKKGDDGKYQPIEALNIQLIDPLAAAEAQNIIGADGITVKVLVGDDSSLPIEYDHYSPITLEAFLADMKPGYYWIKAEQTDENSPYDGTVYSSQFTVVEKYDLLVKPANDFSKGKIESVTVGSGSVTIDANGKASKTGIAPDTEVKIKAKRGYVIDKVEAKKGIAPPDPVTVTWNNLNFNSNPYTRDGVTLTAGNNSATGNAFYNYGDKTFTTTLGKFTKIEMVCEGNNFNGWAKESAGGYQIPEGPYVEVFRLTWTGNAESVTIPGGNYIYGISSITFTIQ